MGCGTSSSGAYQDDADPAAKLAELQLELKWAEGRKAYAQADLLQKQIAHLQARVDGAQDKKTTFSIGDKVVWMREDVDIPAGCVGTIIGFNSSMQPRVEFKGRNFAFPDDQLQHWKVSRASPHPPTPCARACDNVTKSHHGVALGECVGQAETEEGRADA